MRQSGSNEDGRVPHAAEVLGRGYYALITLGCLTLAVAYCQRVNLSLVIVEVVQTDGGGGRVGEVRWTSVERGVVQCSLYFGYFLTQFVGGILALRVGGKILITLSLTFSSLLTFVSPRALAYSPWILSLVRMLMGAFQGFLLTSIQILGVNWFTAGRNSTALSFIFTGTQWGSILGFLLTSALARLPDSWEYSFYLFGLMGLAVGLAWHVWVTDSPRDHRYITPGERLYLATACKEREKIRPGDVPLRAIFLSKHCLVLFFCEFTSMWITFTVLTIYPKYLFAKFGFQVDNQMVASTVPYLANAVAITAAGVLSDHLISRRRVPKIWVRKVVMFLGICPCSFVFLLTTLLPRNRGNLGVFLFSVGNFLNGFQVVVLHNVVDLSPKFCSTVMGIASTFGTLGGTIAPLINEIITRRQSDVANWQIVYGICGAIGALSSTCFALWASCSVQPWDRAPRTTAL